MVTLNTCYTLQFYTGLQADTKPLGVPNGSMFLEMDTGKLFRFDAENQTWIDQANPTPSGGTFMIVTFTFDADLDAFVADKTYAEIVAAVADGEIVVGIVAPNMEGVSYLLQLSAIEKQSDGGSHDQVTFISQTYVNGEGVGTYEYSISGADESVTRTVTVYPGE